MKKIFFLEISYEKQNLKQKYGWFILKLKKHLQEKNVRF